MKFTANQEVGVSVETLYKHFGSKLRYCTIEVENQEPQVAYYDLINEKGVIACMDGEECVVMEVEGDKVFLNVCNGEPVMFTLTKTEAEIGIFQEEEREEKEMKKTYLVSLSSEYTRDTQVWTGKGAPDDWEDNDWNCFSSDLLLGLVTATDRIEALATIKSKNGLESLEDHAFAVIEIAEDDK